MITNQDARTIMYEEGRRQAIDLQSRAEAMSGTELYAEDSIIPMFSEAVKVDNMLNRPIGFVCKSSAGRVVKLIQNYDSSTYTQEPEELPAQWGFKWSTDPKKALPFISLSTSPYMTGDCCLDSSGAAKRSTIDYNVWSPEGYPSAWEDA